MTDNIEQAKEALQKWDTALAVSGGPYEIVEPMGEAGYAMAEAIRTLLTALDAAKDGQAVAWFRDDPLRPISASEYETLKRAGQGHGFRPLYTAPRPAPAADRMAIRLLVAAGFVTEAKANDALNIAHGFQKGELEPAPAVPEGHLQDCGRRWRG